MLPHLRGLSKQLPAALHQDARCPLVLLQAAPIQPYLEEPPAPVRASPLSAAQQLMASFTVEWPAEPDLDKPGIIQPGACLYQFLTI